MRDNIIWTPELQDELDMQFIQRIQHEVTQSCALPFNVPTDRIPEFIVQAAQWFWTHVDQACEERNYVIPNSEICKSSPLNKVIQLPPQIVSVFGCHKVQSSLSWGLMGDFSLERVLFNGFSGMGINSQGQHGINLIDAMVAMYELDTFDQFINPPLTYNFNEFSSKLVLLGNLGRSDLIVQTYVRCRIQDLYNSYYFFRLCVAFCKRALSTIYGTYEFKLPGGVTINYSNFQDQAQEEIDKIYEWADNNKSTDYFFVSGRM